MSSTQPKLPTKRKATEDLNPLLAAAKRVKKDQAKTLANKRQLLNGEEKEKAGGSGGHRRKSSVGSRGKRISEVFENTGIISQPHNSVSDSSFYKHIDLDLDEPERVRQLLTWCSARAASSYATSPPSTSIASSSTASPPSKLPVLSAVGATAIKNVQDSMLRMLAEKKIPIRLYSKDESNEPDDGSHKKENAQNTKNRQWETTYSSQIQRARQEADRWNHVDTFYEDYLKRITPTDSQSPSTPSSKSKGKQRASDDDIDEDDDWKIREHALPETLRSGLDLAKAVLSQMKTRGKGEKRIVGPASTYAAHIRECEEREAELRRQEKDLEFNLDMINSFLNTARETTNIAEATLDQRFALLSFSLASRSNPMPPESAGTGHLLSSYVPRELGGIVSGGSADPQELMRALANVDRERPPSQVGDAARRAVREVQRAEERGAGIGERRLTGVPMVPTTPRKMPGTPRRATTPGRGTTPGRDREYR